MALTYGEKLAPFLTKLRNKQPCLLLVLGDSNACNATFTRGGKQWPELLHQELRDYYATQRILLLNSGICGDSVNEALARWETDVARFQPDCVIVDLGSNDANRLTDEVFRTGLEEILRRLEAMGTCVLIKTFAPVMEYEPRPPHLWKGDDKRRSKLAIVRALAEGHRLPMVDTYAQWWAAEKTGALGVSTLMHDAVHTNAAGHALVFRGVAAAFGLPGTLAWERS